MNNNSLIVYYSHSGNTRKLAKLIEQEFGGTLCELETENAYPSDYNTVVEQAKKEIQAGFRPVLKTTIKDITTYDQIFIGTPNWWNTIASPVATFLENCDFSGKTVVPFCTHGGGGSGNIEATVKKLCPGSNVLPALAIYGNTAKDSQVGVWLKMLGVK